MKKFIITLSIVLFTCSFCSAQTVYDDNYVENPNYLEGLKYLQNSQYTSAVAEFKKALRANPSDSSSIIGLFNAYNSRAEYYSKQKMPEKALSDVKSALFFARRYADNSSAISSAAVSTTENNIRLLENSLQLTTPQKRFETAKAERLSGEFAAAAYDYYVLSNNSEYKFVANVGLGDIYVIFNRPEKAREYYKSALAVNPSDTEAHLKLAQIYEQTGDFSSSLDEYNKALTDSEENADILASLERIWQKKVDENPKDAEAHSNLGVVFQKQKRFNEAYTEYKKAEALNPANVNTKINIATLYQDQKKYSLALNTYNNILLSQPKNAKVLLYKAECLKELDKTDDAIAAYKSVLNIEPANNTAKTALFALLKNSMTSEEVLDYMYKNLKSSPLSAEGCYEFAYELHKAKKLDDALVYYSQAIKLNDKMTDAYVNSAQIYREKHDYDSALDMITKAKNIEPDNKIVLQQYDLIEKERFSAGINSAGDAYQSGDYQKAVELYSRINPPTADSLTGLAASYQALKQNDKALEYYKKAFELSPKNAELPYYIAALYADADNLDEARKYVNRSLSLNSSSSKAKELLSYLDAKAADDILDDAMKLYDNGKYKESIALFDKVLTTDASNATVYYYRAMSYDALKDYKKAISDYKSVLKHSPEMVIAYYMLGVDYDALNDYASAKQNYAKYVELATEEDDYKKYAQTRLSEINQ